MSKAFRYIQNDDVLRTFNELKETTLKERPLVIARHGDYSLLLESHGDDTLGIKIVNNDKNEVVSDRLYITSKTTDALVSRGVRHACQRMAELNDEDANKKRIQIWKWYLIEWNRKHPEETENLFNPDNLDEFTMKTEAELMDMESFLHGDYLNLGNTLGLIDTYVQDARYNEIFKKFAIADIMEMTREDTKDRAISEAEKQKDKEGEIKYHNYTFTVSVEATDKERARAALLNYLAGDPRIRVQK
jgi:hypothetical protein